MVKYKKNCCIFSLVSSAYVLGIFLIFLLLRPLHKSTQTVLSPKQHSAETHNSRSAVGLSLKPGPLKDPWS